MPNKISRNSGSFTTPYEYKPGMHIGTKGWKSHGIAATKARNMVKLGFWKSETEKKTYTKKVDIEERMTSEFTEALKNQANPLDIAKGMASIEFEVPQESSYSVMPLQDQSNPLQDAMEMIKGFEDKRISYAQELEIFKDQACSYRVDQYQIIGQQKFETVTQDMAYDVVKKTIASADTAQSLAAIKMTLGTEPSTLLMTSKQREMLVTKLQKKAKNICKHETKALSKLQAPVNATTDERQRAAEDKLHQIHRLVFAIDTLDRSFFHKKTEKGKTLCEMADACLRDYHANIHNVHDFQSSEEAQKKDTKIEFLFSQRFVPILDIAGARGNTSVEAKENRYREMQEARKEVASFALEIIKTMRELPQQYKRIAEIEEQIQTIKQTPDDIEATRQLEMLRNELKRVKGDKSATKKAVTKQLHKLAKHPSSDNMSGYMEPIIEQFDNRKCLDESDLDLLEYQYQLDDLPPPAHLQIDDQNVDDIQKKRNRKMVPPGKSYHMDESHWAEKMKLALRDQIHPMLTVLRTTSQGGLRWQADYQTIIKNLEFLITLELAREQPESPEKRAEIANDITLVRTNINELLNTLANNTHFGEQGQAITEELRRVYRDQLALDIKKKGHEQLQEQLKPVMKIYEQLSIKKASPKIQTELSPPKPTNIVKPIQHQGKPPLSSKPDSIVPTLPSRRNSVSENVKEEKEPQSVAMPPATDNGKGPRYENPSVLMEGPKSTNAEPDLQPSTPLKSNAQSTSESNTQPSVTSTTDKTAPPPTSSPNREKGPRYENTSVLMEGSNSTKVASDLQQSAPLTSNEPSTSESNAQPSVPSATDKPVAPPPPPPPPAPDKARSVEEDSDRIMSEKSKDETKMPSGKTDDARANLMDEIRRVGKEREEKKAKGSNQGVGTEPKSSSDADITHEPENKPTKASEIPDDGMVANMNAKIRGKRTPLKIEILEKIGAAEFYDSPEDLADDLISDIKGHHEEIKNDDARFIAVQLANLTNLDDSSEDDLEDQVDEILKRLQAPPA